MVTYNRAFFFFTLFLNCNHEVFLFVNANSIANLIPRSVVGEQADGVINTLIAALATICDEEYKSLVDAYKPGEIAPVLTDADKTMEDADRELGIGDIVWVFYNKDKVGPYWWPASIIGSSGVGMYDVAWLPYRGDGVTTKNVDHKFVKGFGFRNSFIGIHANNNAKEATGWDIVKAFDEAWRIYAANKVDEARAEFNHNLDRLVI